MVIVGGGFGGLWAAQALRGEACQVLLLDRHNYHSFFPLLYQVAAAELEPEQIAHPVRSILRRLANARFLMARVEAVDLSRRRVRAEGLGEIEYDYLILATGSASDYFGIPGAAEHAFPLRTMEEAIELRNHLLGCFERAVQEREGEERARLLSFVIVGGGPTGVEFAGALAELVFRPLVRDFPALDFSQVRVILVEALERLLPSMPPPLGAYAASRLEAMGVEVRLDSMVSRISPAQVELKAGAIIPSRTVVWTAGVRGDPGAQDWGLPLTRRGQVEVGPTLQLPGHPEVYVVGDLAHFQEEGRALPMVAPVALQQGTHAAGNIARELRGQEPLPFRYRDRGMMATIGRNAAVAHLGRLTFAGFPAWLVWLATHLVKLIGFRNRLMVLISWAWRYVSYEQAVRLILTCGPEPEGVPETREG